MKGLVGKNECEGDDAQGKKEEDQKSLSLTISLGNKEQSNFTKQFAKASR